MKIKKTDRRSIKSIKALRNALVTLILKKNYDEITIQEIIDEANIGRSTFYTHFYDKDDLLTSEFDNIMQDQNANSVVNNEVIEQPNPIGLPSLYIFNKHANEDLRIYKALNNSSAIRFLNEKLYNNIRTLLDKGINQAKITDLTVIQKEYICHHTAQSLGTTLRWWLDNDRPCSPQEIHTLFENIAMEGVYKSLGITHH